LKKIHIVSDILFWLTQLTNIKSTTLSLDKFDILNEFHTDMKEFYYVSLLKLSLKLKDHFVQKYENNNNLKKIQKLLKNNSENYLKKSFKYWDKLLYNIADSHDRLIILKNLHKKVFYLTYNNNNHVSLHWCYQWLSESLYNH